MCLGKNNQTIFDGLFYVDSYYVPFFHQFSF